jgi:hypothetical protein
MAEEKPNPLQGWLEKQGEDLFKGWKKRWFYQKEEPSKLHYSKDPSSNSLGFIDLQRVSEVTPGNKDEFKLVTPERVYVFKGTSQMNTSLSCTKL